MYRNIIKIVWHPIYFYRWFPVINILYYYSTFVTISWLVTIINYYYTLCALYIHTFACLSSFPVQLLLTEARPCDDS